MLGKLETVEIFDAPWYNLQQDYMHDGFFPNGSQWSIFGWRTDQQFEIINVESKNSVHCCENHQTTGIYDLSFGKPPNPGYQVKAENSIF
jgi:hypothetical protein